MAKASSLAPAMRWIGLGLLLLLGWRVATLGLADHFSQGAPERALGFRAAHPEANIALAERLVRVDPGADRVAQLARAALGSDPLDGRSYRLLAQHAEAKNDRDEAGRLYSLAAVASPRDVPSRIWLANHFLARGDLGSALGHMDFLLRVSPGTTNSLYPPLIAIASATEAQGPLVERLAANPPWRAGVMAYLLRRADVDAIAPFVDALRRAPGGLSQDELAAWLDRLIQEQRWGKAYLMWVSQLPADRLSGLASLNNGGFESAPDGTLFDWQFRTVPGAGIERTAGEGVSGGSALRVRFADRRVPFNHVRQLLALPPGQYALRGRARPEALLAMRGLVWSVSCAGKGSTPLAETEPLRGDGPWRDFSTYFEVPAQGCGGQWLTLKLSARGASEQHIAGVAWFDDLRVTRP